MNEAVQVTTGSVLREALSITRTPTEQLAELDSDALQEKVGERGKLESSCP